MQSKTIKRKVLMVSDVYLPRINGVSTSIKSFRHNLPNHGIDVHVVAPRYGNEHNEEGITRYSGYKVPRSPEDRIAKWNDIKRVVYDTAKDYDLIHTHTPFAAHYAGMHAANKHGIPIITTYHTLFEEYFRHYVPFIPPKILKAIARFISRRQCNKLDAVIVPSTAMMERMKSYGVTAPLFQLPTGISLTSFANGEAGDFRARHNITEDRPLALYVGRVAHEKNIGFILESLQHALKQNPDILLAIAGGGPAMQELKNEVNNGDLKDAVRFIGYLDHETELPSCYAAADVFVFASRTETQGLVLAEALAAGLPVIALSEMGTADILRDQRGCISPPLCTKTFGSTIAKVLNQPELRNKLSEEAKIYSEEWSDDTAASKLAKLYTEIIG